MSELKVVAKIRFVGATAGLLANKVRLADGCLAADIMGPQAVVDAILKKDDDSERMLSVELAVDRPVDPSRTFEIPFYGRFQTGWQVESEGFVVRQDLSLPVPTRTYEQMKEWLEDPIFRLAPPISEETLDHLVELAIQRFGYPPEECGNEIFNSAGFQTSYKAKFGFDLSSEELISFLESMPNVVRLDGGCHWMRLREPAKKYLPEDPEPHNLRGRAPSRAALVDAVNALIGDKIALLEQTGLTKEVAIDRALQRVRREPARTGSDYVVRTIARHFLGRVWDQPGQLDALMTAFDQGLLDPDIDTLNSAMSYERPIQEVVQQVMDRK